MVAHYCKGLQDYRADFGNQVHLPWHRHPLESIVVSIRLRFSIKDTVFYPLIPLEIQIFNEEN
jgi:hypothetical protein